MMKIENVIELKTSPEIWMQSFRYIFSVSNFFSVVWRVWKHELHETFFDNDLKNGWLLNFEGQNIDDSGRSLSDIAKPKEKTYIGRKCTLVTQKLKRIVVPFQSQ